MLWSINERLGALMPPDSNAGAAITPLSGDVLLDIEAIVLWDAHAQEQARKRAEIKSRTGLDYDGPEL